MTDVPGRRAGAIVLGKANLSEWANYRGNSSSGWSGRGGQCLNPHVLDNTPGGSSSGSGAAVCLSMANMIESHKYQIRSRVTRAHALRQVAAALCAMAVGSETDGSIVSPSVRAVPSR